jgi:hypothetical protein
VRPHGAGDPRNAAALPLEVRPVTGPRKELPPQFPFTAQSVCCLYHGGSLAVCYRRKLCPIFSTR